MKFGICLVVLMLIFSGNVHCAVKEMSKSAIPSPASTTPNNIAPENGSRFAEKSVTFSWTDYAGATSYKLEAASSQDFGKIVYSATTTKTQSSTILDSGSYFWRVRGIGRTGASAWSSAWMVTIDTSPIPVAYWQFEETAGDVVTDKYGHIGKVRNAYINQAGKVGRAVSLAGSTTGSIFSDYVLAQTNNFTMMAWIKPFVLPQHNAVIAMNGTGSNGWGISISGINSNSSNSSNLWVVHGGVSWLDTGYTFVSTGTWYHVAYVRYNGVDSFYVNGIKVGLDLSGGSVNLPANSIGIGRMPPGYDWSPAFNGSIDEFAIYNVPLPGAIILDLYSRSSGRKHY